jgi:hypothetical protein
MSPLMDRSEIGSPNPDSVEADLPRVFLTGAIVSPGVFWAPSPELTDAFTAPINRPTVKVGFVPQRGY